MSEVRTGRAFAVIALFDTPGALLAAIPKVRAQGFENLEAYTPYPVHGVLEALKVKRSPLPAMVLAMGFLGTALALLFQWWTSAVDYPVDVGGKALFSWQAFVPIMFEVTVLFATFTAGLGMLFLLNKLPFFGHPVLESRAVKSFTRDRFALAVEAWGGELDAAAASRALEAAGGAEVEVLNEPEWERSNTVLPVRELVALVLACAVAGAGMYQAVKWFPLLPPMNHFSTQNRLVAYEATKVFADGRAMRMPVAGTVARGYLPLDVKTPEEAGKVLANPLPVTMEVLERGRRQYQNHCQVCHGALGEGKPTLSAAYTAKPANLQSSTIMGYPDGRIYYVISHGYNSMPAYAGDLSPDDRWAVVHYVRALQRSQHAREEDLK